jgi:hypothetical protein
VEKDDGAIANGEGLGSKAEQAIIKTLGPTLIIITLGPIASKEPDCSTRHILISSSSGLYVDGYLRRDRRQIFV